MLSRKSAIITFTNDDEKSRIHNIKILGFMLVTVICLVIQNKKPF